MVVVETCKLPDLDPVAYMIEAVRRRRLDPEDILMPDAWREELRANEAPSREHRLDGQVRKFGKLCPKGAGRG